MSRYQRTVVALSLMAAMAAPCVAQESRWGAADDDVVKFMTTVESKWANAACSVQPDLKDFIADDFQGTSTKGQRIGKAVAITTDPKSLASACHLDELKVRFFGDAVAVAYGAESRVPHADDGHGSRRCQVWTDTWLKREGKWQIVAAQDTIVPCNP
jgi:hypothetical protein